MTKKDYKLIVSLIAYNYNTMQLNLKLNKPKQRILADAHLSLLHSFAQKLCNSNTRFDGTKFYNYFVKELQYDMPKDLLQSAKNLITKL